MEEVFASGFPFFNLYRLAVIARGRKLIEAGSSEESGPSRGVAGAAMRVFRVLFRANRTRSRLGWQIVGIARVPGSPSAA